MNKHKGFGVETPEKIKVFLIKKSITGDTIYLSATPIPRSLSLTYFGSLEVTILNKTIKHQPNSILIILETKISTRLQGQEE